MKKLYKVFILLGLFIAFSVSAETYGDQQLLPVTSWVYDALYTLNAEQKRVTNADIGPCSVQELKLYFSLINYEELSDAGKDLYDRVQNFFDEKKFSVNLNPVHIGFNVQLYPEVLYKSNSDIDWTFGSHETYTGEKEIYKDETKTGSEPISETYNDASAWGGNKLAKPLFSFPVYIDFGNIAFIETDPFITNSFVYMVRQNNFTNIPLAFQAMDFMQPTTAYFSIGHLFKNNIGIDFQVGKEGMQIGRALTGSVIYNNTFQSDAYFKFDFYSPRFKYNLDVVEVSTKKFIYLHNIEGVIFPWLRVGLMEGNLINESFELRFLNPLMIMHSYHFWTEYRTADEYDVYREAHASAYFAATFDVVPIKNLRIYGIYSQIELQIPPELETEYGRHLPNSFAFQLGAEYNLPVENNGLYFANIEGFYSTPYMYYKTGADWSWYKKRFDNYDTRHDPICSWVGSTFGPDSAGFELKAGYKSGSKWSADIAYNFLAKGENSFNLFYQTVEADGKTYWIYYPSTYINGSYAKETSLARSLALLGTVEFKNSIELNGFYRLNDHFSFDGQLVYTFVFNNNHVKNNFEQGLQLAFGMEYKLF